MSNKYIFGVFGDTLLDNEVALMRKCDLFGIVLFQRNIYTEDQVIKLNQDIKNKLGSHVKICIDQEGGKVQRIKFSKAFPSMQDFGEKYLLNNKNGIDYIRENVGAMSAELKSLGFDMNFAPVCDLGDNNSFIGSRSFGIDQNIVNNLASEFIDLSGKSGIECVLKHIPGLGCGRIDTHLDIVHFDNNFSSFVSGDANIFKTLSKKANYAMIGHIIYDFLDQKPASISAEVIQFIRSHIGFTGEIITDAIEMGGLMRYYDNDLESSCKSVNYYHNSIKYKVTDAEKKMLRQIAEESFAAGCDIVMYCGGNLDATEYILS